MNFCARSSVSRGVLKPIACAALAVTLLSQPASAVTVRFGAFDYDIQFYGLGTSFSSAENETPSILETPWWGLDTPEFEAREDVVSLAEAYRVQVGVNGSPFTDDSSQFTKIRFAYKISDENLGAVNFALVNEYFPNATRSSALSSEGDPDATYAYAASVSPVPLPPAGLALGAALLGLLGLRRWKAAVASRTA